MELKYLLADIQAAACEVWRQIDNNKIVAFSGEMGTGKTTFIKALCLEQNVKNTSSPTFSIINEYESSVGKIFHIDLYRLSSLQEVIDAGVEDCIYSGDICLIEWPEKAISLFPSNTIYIRINAIDEVTRSIRIGDN